jgi:hypothetical protein
MVNLITKGLGILGALKVAGFGYGTVEVCNKTGGSLTSGMIVYISGFDATLRLPKIVKADADTSGKAGQFVVKETIANNRSGFVYEKAEIGDLNTNAGVVGDPVYLSATAGEWTLTPPVGADQIVQIIGWITVKSATIGKIVFLINPQNITVVGTSGIAADAITKLKLSGGFSKVTLAAGTASGANVTIAGMAVGDEIVSVLSFTTAAAIATVADRTSEYVAGAGVMTKAAGTNDTNNQLLVIWNDLT